MNNILEFKKQELKLLESGNFVNNPEKYLKWFLLNADFFTDINLKLSQNVSDETYSRVKSCYHNCWKAITEPQYYFKLSYYEGFVWSKDCQIPLEHSWLVCSRSGKVVDPTLIISGETVDKQLKQDGYKFENEFKARQKRYGDEYFGVRIPTMFVKELVREREQTGSFLFDFYLSELGVK